MSENARRDWWRFWAARRKGNWMTRDSVSVTVTISGREYTIGYRRKRWVE